MFRPGRDPEGARKEALAAAPGYDNTAGQDDDLGMGDAIGSLIQATMFGLIRTFDDASYESYEAHEGAAERERRR